MKINAKVPTVRKSLPRISDQARQISEYMARELTSWPDVKTKPMFGLTALYRGNAIFAVLPKTRGMESNSSIAFKLVRKTPSILKLLGSDTRVVTPGFETARWISFEVQSDRDIGDALEWFGRAYEQAAPRRK